MNRVHAGINRPAFLKRLFSGGSQSRWSISIFTEGLPKTMMCLSFFLLTSAIFAPQGAHATPILVANAVEISQNNNCVNCNGVQQANMTVIHQKIRLAEWWFAPANSSLILELANLATINQLNFCDQCLNVTQMNDSFVYQFISPPVILPGSPFATPPPPPAPPTLVGNLAQVNQLNFCQDCLNDLQGNFAEIDQYLLFREPITLSPGTPLSQLINFAVVTQVNSCLVCDSVLQNNLAVVYQDIRPVPEPGTIVLFGSGLVGLIMRRLMRKSEHVTA